MQQGRQHAFSLSRYVFILIVVWTILMGGTLWFFGLQAKRTMVNQARIQARTSFERDLLYRRWNAGHGGVYAPVTGATPPNPYLSHLPERDITTPSGRELTLINPAYMIRQMYEQALADNDFRGHITSLKPIRLANRADAWETLALTAFERGVEEVSSLEVIKGKEYLRLMRPLFTEKACLQCHAVQGYREGDIRGGLSVAVPMAGHRQELSRHLRGDAVILALVWLAGLAVLGLVGRCLRRSEALRRKAEESLERQVEERTRELSESEEKFRAMSASATDAIIMVDGTDTIIFWNMAATTIFGYAEDQVMGSKLHRLLVPPRYHDAWGKGFPRFTESGGGPVIGKTLEVTALRKNGAEFPVELSISSVNLSGKWCAIGIVRDISVRKKIEQEMQAAQAQVVRQARLATIGKLAGAVAHDLRNPLGVISNSAYFLNQVVTDQGDARIKKHLHIMTREVGRSSDIIDDLMDLSEEPKSVFVKGDINAMVKDILDTQPLPATITLTQTLPGNPPALYFDPRQMRRVCLNLLTNAIQAMPEGGELEVSSRSVDHAIELVFRDSGPGILPEHLGKIFEPLFTTKTRGIGLGLSIVKTFVNQHNGRVEVESVFGKGTIFTVRLPISAHHP